MGNRNQLVAMLFAILYWVLAISGMEFCGLFTTISHNSIYKYNVKTLGV